MGTAIVGGMLFSTVLNLIFIPVLYVIMKTWLAAFSGKAKKKSPAWRTSLPSKPRMGPYSLVLFLCRHELLHHRLSHEIWRKQTLRQDEIVELFLIEFHSLCG